MRISTQRVVPVPATFFVTAHSAMTLAIMVYILMTPTDAKQIFTLVHDTHPFTENVSANEKLLNARKYNKSRIYTQIIGSKKPKSSR
jgi:hypothetical protein